MQLARTTSAGRNLVWAFISALVAAALITTLLYAAAPLAGGSSSLGAGVALAGKPRPITPSQGSCSVAPNPTAVFGTYTVSARGLPANVVVSVAIQDSHATSFWWLQTAASGTMTGSGTAYWAGTSKVSIYQKTSRGDVFLTSCSFQVG